MNQETITTQANTFIEEWKEKYKEELKKGADFMFNLGNVEYHLKKEDDEITLKIK